MRAIVEVGAILAPAVVMSSTATVFAQERDPRMARGERLFTAPGCCGCHRLGKFGTCASAAHMPRLELTAEDIELLAGHLSALE